MQVPVERHRAANLNCFFGSSVRSVILDLLECAISTFDIDFTSCKQRYFCFLFFEKKGTLLSVLSSVPCSIIPLMAIAGIRRRAGKTLIPARPETLY